MEPKRRTPGQLLAWVVIALGLSILVGGVGAIAVMALRTSSGAAVIGSATPSVTPGPPSLPAPGRGSPAEPGGSAGAGAELARPDASAARPAPVLPAEPDAAGAIAAASEEASAAIPVTPARAISGTSSADVTVSLFGDLTCSHTLRTLRGFARLRERHGARVRFVFYHRPLGDDSAPRRLARAVALATVRDGPAAGWAALEASAAGAEPANAAATALEQGRVEALLADDERLAAVLDVRGTPTLFVNGARSVGEPEEGVLESAIQREQRAVGWLRAQGVPPERVYVQRVRKNLIEVEGGAPDRACVPRGDAPELGPDDALVTLVEFSGFECPGCRELAAAIGKVVGRHPKEVRRVFRGLAPQKPSRARRVAAFALSAQSALGDRAFWALYRELRAAPAGLDDSGLLAVARRAGLDGERLLALAADETNERRLNRDLELAGTLNVASVPALFVNGRLLPGALSTEGLEAVVSEELAMARRIARAGTPPSRFDELLCRSR
jgi:protein-disulfide isomerase